MQIRVKTFYSIRLFRNNCVLFIWNVDWRTSIKIIKSLSYHVISMRIKYERNYHYKSVIQIPSRNVSRNLLFFWGFAHWLKILGNENQIVALFKCRVFFKYKFEDIFLRWFKYYTFEKDNDNFYVKNFFIR